MQALDKKRSDFIERMGIAMERMGAPNTFGRLFGLLLVAEEPISLEDMAEILKVTKPSISTNVRQFEQAQLAERIRYPGERKHYYVIRPGAIEKTMLARVPLLTQMAELATSGLDSIGPDNMIARQRLEETRDFYAFLGEEMTQILNRWKERKMSRNGVNQ